MGIFHTPERHNYTVLLLRRCSCTKWFVPKHLSLLSDYSISELVPGAGVRDCSEMKCICTASLYLTAEYISPAWSTSVDGAATVTEVKKKILFYQAEVERKCWLVVRAGNLRFHYSLYNQPTGWVQAINLASLCFHSPYLWNGDNNTNL